MYVGDLCVDLSTEGTVKRWNIWMEACGVEEEFEIGSTQEGTQQEGDDNIRTLFVGKPFVATVKLEKNGQYTNNDIQMIHYVRSWTPEQKDAMDVWLDAQEKAGGQGGGTPEVGDDNDRAPARGGGSFTDDEDYGPVGGGTQAGGFAGGDDDIPF